MFDYLNAFWLVPALLAVVVFIVSACDNNKPSVTVKHTVVTLTCGVVCTHATMLKLLLG